MIEDQSLGGGASGGGAGWVTRFAPSPTGRLHAGHAHAAGFAAALAERGGRFLLRLEDIDPGRCRVEHAVAILRDLRWLGLRWAGPVRRQSRHLAEYRAVLAALEGRGLLYPCFCTRAEVAREVAAAGAAPHGPEGPRYPGTCRGMAASRRAERLAAGEMPAWRLDMAAAVRAAPAALGWRELGEGWVAADPEPFGDVVLGRRDAPASYHLCVTHDDAAQGVTLVTRGEDLRPATALHRLLQALLGWPTPAYAHHRLVLGADGRRLAKRDASATLAAQREAGVAQAAVLAAARAEAAALTR
jgi:glutamyl-Q tRNA(Asp) synthetase